MKMYNERKMSEIILPGYHSQKQLHPQQFKL